MYHISPTFSSSHIDSCRRVHIFALSSCCTTLIRTICVVPSPSNALTQDTSSPFIAHFLGKTSNDHIVIGR